MDNITPSTGRPLFAAGLLLALAAIGAYAALLVTGHLITPWFLPLAFFVALITTFLARRRRKTVMRTVMLIVLFVLGAFFSYGLFGSAAPRYAGPMAVGQAMPAFAAVDAEGRPFTQATLPGAKATVLTFFRGRW
jgi:hypothetical protein